MPEFGSMLLELVRNDPETWPMLHGKCRSRRENGQLRPKPAEFAPKYKDAHRLELPRGENRIMQGARVQATETNCSDARACGCSIAQPHFMEQAAGQRGAHPLWEAAAWTTLYNQARGKASSHRQATQIAGRCGTGPKCMAAAEAGLPESPGFGSPSLTLAARACPIPEELRNG